MFKSAVRSIFVSISLIFMTVAVAPELAAQQKIEGAPQRSWTGPIFGGATIQATPISFDGQDLKLRTEGGEMAVPLARLSEDDQKYVRELLKNPPKKATARVSDFSRGIVDVQKYLPHLPKAALVKRIKVPVSSDTVYTNWHYCVSGTFDDQTLVMSRFHRDKWCLSYRMDSETLGPVFDTPSNNEVEAIYHVISSKDPDKCYVGLVSGIICEYKISTGRILRQINCKGRPKRLYLSKDCDKLYIAGTPAVWDLKANRITQIADYDANCIALDSTERQMAVGAKIKDKGVVMLYNARTRKPPQPIQATGKNVWSVRFINDDKLLLVGTSDPPTAAIHGVSTGKAICTIGGFDAERITDVFCNADQSLLFVVQSQVAWEGEPTIVFDTQTMLPVCMFNAGYHMENAVLTSDEKRLILPTCRSFCIYEMPDREAIDKTIEQMKALDR